MFKKYFAHEFKNSSLMPLTICGVTLAISILIAISSILKIESLLIFGLSALFVTLYIFFFMSIHSIHKTMTERLFTKSGYLTLTLPIGTHTVLISKILINVLYVFMYIASFLLGAFIITGSLALENLGEMFNEIGNLIGSIVAEFDVVLIKIVTMLISFIFVLCSILFANAFSNSGIIKKESKITNFILTIVFILLLTTILNIQIIPYVLCYEADLGYFIENTNNKEFYYYGSTLIDFSSMLWMILGIFGFYFGSYYLIKNKIDIL